MYCDNTLRNVHFMRKPLRLQISTVTPRRKSSADLDLRVR